MQMNIIEENIEKLYLKVGVVRLNLTFGQQSQKKPFITIHRLTLFILEDTKPICVVLFTISL